MSTDFAALNREANLRGQRDYERGVPRSQNPFKDDHATEQAQHWYEGWDSMYDEDVSS